MLAGKNEYQLNQAGMPQHLSKQIKAKVGSFKKQQLSNCKRSTSLLNKNLRLLGIVKKKSESCPQSNP